MLGYITWAKEEREIPHKIKEGIESWSISVLRTALSPITCSCPRTSFKLVGRNLSINNMSIAKRIERRRDGRRKEGRECEKRKRKRKYQLKERPSSLYLFVSFSLLFLLPLLVSFLPLHQHSYLPYCF